MQKWVVAKLSSCLQSYCHSQVLLCLNPYYKRRPWDGCLMSYFHFQSRTQNWLWKSPGLGSTTSGSGLCWGISGFSFRQLFWLRLSTELSVEKLSTLPVEWMKCPLLFRWLFDAKGKVAEFSGNGLSCSSTSATTVSSCSEMAPSSWRKLKQKSQ